MHQVLRLLSSSAALSYVMQVDQPYG